MVLKEFILDSIGQPFFCDGVEISRVGGIRQEVFKITNKVDDRGPSVKKICKFSQTF